MGRQARDRYPAPGLRPSLFDRSRNVGPTVWWNGRVVGGWAQRADGEIAWRLLDVEGVGRAGEAAIEAEVDRLRGWSGSARVTPRFRTPLERELVAQALSPACRAPPPVGGRPAPVAHLE